LSTLPEKRIHRLFEVSVALKGISALAECVGGIAFALVSVSTIKQMVLAVTQGELSENPNDPILSYLAGWAQSFSASTKTVVVVYLLIDGVLKLFLLVGLLRHRLWAYPASIVVITLFIFYQMYSFALTQSLGLIALTIFDCMLIFLIWHEHRLVRAASMSRMRPRKEASHPAPTLSAEDSNGAEEMMLLADESPACIAHACGLPTSRP
jgi:uncharacterized membrane protein